MASAVVELSSKRCPLLSLTADVNGAWRKDQRKKAET
jgi:hypothetical protein